MPIDRDAWRWVPRRLADATRWVMRQAAGTLRRTRGLFSGFGFDKILPNAIEGIISELMALIPRAAGRGSAKQQVYASITLIILAVISSVISAGATLIIAVLLLIPLSIGLARMVPWINDRFTGARGRRLRDRDVPLWTRD